MSIEKGTVLWHICGREQNGVIKWYENPVCVESVSETRIMFTNGCGCSANSIGKSYYMSRDEAIEKFLEKHDSMTERIEIGEALPDDVHSLPRTDWDDQIIYKSNFGVNDCGVYLGGLSKLNDITNKIDWDSFTDSQIAPDGSMETLYEEETLTLRKIYEQVSSFAKNEIITVIQNDPMRACIYQCNNYERGKWVCLCDSVMGYA